MAEKTMCLKKNKIKYFNYRKLLNWNVATCHILCKCLLKQQNSFILTSCYETAFWDCQKEHNTLKPALFKML